MTVRVAIAPHPAPDYAREAASEAGATVVDLPEAEALLWTAPAGPELLAETLRGPRSALRWVHLRWAGIEDFARLGLLDPDLVWTCGKGVFAEPVAEHALALALAGLRDLPQRVRASSWGAQSGVSLFGRDVLILGGGGISEALVELLRPFRTTITVVRRSRRPMRWVHRVVGPDRLDQMLAEADVVFVAWALTPETEAALDGERLRLLRPGAWLVNVGRGRHVVTEDLVEVLREGRIGGAALDVTDPEPLPDGHPLWTLPNVVITPHTANTYEMAVPLMKQRIVDNLRRFAAGKPLIGLVDPASGY
ncbi:MAG TPA: D-isomer specific 2-hydroxyacid dehydrogenase family protein [Acidimicrobiales bacterium]|nr:D-isomer specific 2-hydroxyacid dehydrogenase family protein [Acidimicrobiales bacterium]